MLRTPESPFNKQMEMAGCITFSAAVLKQSEQFLTTSGPAPVQMWMQMFLTK